MICFGVTWPISNERPATIAVDLDHMTFHSCHCVHVHTCHVFGKLMLPKLNCRDSAAVVDCSQFHPVNQSSFCLSGKRMTRQTKPV